MTHLAYGEAWFAMHCWSRFNCWVAYNELWYMILFAVPNLHLVWNHME